MSVYLEVIQTLKRRDATVKSILAELEEVLRTTTDRDLKIHLSEVRGILTSPVLKGTTRLTLPLDRPPYKALAAYCQSRIG